jgi:hypothetical protein
MATDTLRHQFCRIRDPGWEKFGIKVPVHCLDMQDEGNHVTLCVRSLIH